MSKVHLSLQSLNDLIVKYQIDVISGVDSITITHMVVNIIIGTLNDPSIDPISYSESYLKIMSHPNHELSWNIINVSLIPILTELVYLINNVNSKAIINGHHMCFSAGNRDMDLLCMEVVPR